MKIEPKSSCCGADIDIQEKGVSQLSFDVDFTCSKCGKYLYDVKVSEFNW